MTSKLGEVIRNQQRLLPPTVSQAVTVSSQFRKIQEHSPTSQSKEMTASQAPAFTNQTNKVYNNIKNKLQSSDLEDQKITQLSGNKSNDISPRPASNSISIGVSGNSPLFMKKLASKSKKQDKKLTINDEQSSTLTNNSTPINLGNLSDRAGQSSHHHHHNHVFEMSLESRFTGKKHQNKNYTTLQSTSLSAKTSPINSQIKKVSVMNSPIPKHQENLLLNMKPTQLSARELTGDANQMVKRKHNLDTVPEYTSASSSKNGKNASNQIAMNNNNNIVINSRINSQLAPNVENNGSQTQRGPKIQSNFNSNSAREKVQWQKQMMIKDGGKSPSDTQKASRVTNSKNHSISIDEHSSSNQFHKYVHSKHLTTTQANPLSRSIHVPESVTKSHAQSSITTPTNQTIGRSKRITAVSISRDFRQSSELKDSHLSSKPNQKKAISSKAVTNQEEQTTPSTKLNLKVYSGAFDVNCMTTKQPKIVLDDLQSAFTKEQVSYRVLNGVSFKGSKSGVRFEAELMKYQDIESVFVVRFKKLAGELFQYKKICSSILEVIAL